MKESDLSRADLAFGRAIGGDDRLVERVAALTSQALSQGHVCLRLFAPEVLADLEQALSHPLSRADLMAALRAHPAIEESSIHAATKARNEESSSSVPRARLA